MQINSINANLDQFVSQESEKNIFGILGECGPGTYTSSAFMVIRPCTL